MSQACFHAPDRAALAALVDLVAGRRIAVLSGAGCSTESGIPDYRGAGRPARGRPSVEWPAFRDQPLVRRRYWARALLGWERMRRARPNGAHRALAALERAGHAVGVVTQNVDGLHHAAGSERVVELHGALARVRCLACGAAEARDDVQTRLVGQNPGFVAFAAQRAHAARPDGDAEFGSEWAAELRLADCVQCSGPLKPDVVMFGESVPAERVAAAMALVDSADVLLVVGSSLAVFSGYRFARHAAAHAMPIAIVNLGPTRADALACVRVSGAAGEVLPALGQALGVALPYADGG